jgi:hypothetical protein
MKTIILSLIGLMELMNNATAQETMQFTFIGNAGGNHESVVLTSVKDLEMNDVEILLMDHRALDTLRTYILRNYIERKSGVAPPIKTATDSLDALADIKVTGVDLKPLYFSKDAFSELVYLAMRYFEIRGPMPPNMNFALQHLRYLGHEEFLHRHLEDTSVHLDPRL